MTFLAPGFLYAAGLVSLGVVLLHLLVTQQPRSEQLPTVRFVPDVQARSTSVAIKPSDLLLLLIRVLTVMLLGAALAQPQLTPDRQKVARIVAVDVSRGAASSAELTDSARKQIAGAAAVILFDSTAREVPVQAAGDSIAAAARAPRAPQRGALTAGLITSFRAAARVREAADSINLVVVSPFLNAERDAATATVRGLWPGRINTVRVAPVSDSASRAAAGTDKQKVTVQWADSGAAGTFWTKRAKVDTIGAVRAGDAVLVSPFARRWSASAKLDANTSVYARWMDGEPAGFEQKTADGCIRSLAFTMPSAGDAPLRPDFLRFTSALSLPCGAGPDLTPLPDAFLTAFQGGARLATATAVKPKITRMTPLVPWLLAAALLFALLEFVFRRRAEGISAATDAELLATRMTGRAA